MHSDEVIRQLDGRLQHHEQFGDSRKIVSRVIERYKFALSMFAARHPCLRDIASDIEALNEAAANDVFGDVLVRAEMEAAIEGLELRDGIDGVKASIEPLLWHLGDALSREGASKMARGAMARPFVVGPEKRTWVWDLPDDSTPLRDKLRETLRTGFMPGSKCDFEPVRPTPRMVEQLDRACSLSYRLLPEVTASVFRHLHSIAIGRIRGPGGRLLTGSGGDSTPCMIFIDPDELENPWDTAGHILHEGIHLKLADLIRTGKVADEEPVSLPWRLPTALSNCVFAFHAYAHLQVFRAAVERLGPSLYAEFGAPHDYQAPAHAMSVVNNSSGPFSRAEQRLGYYYEQLRGEWAPRVTPYGQKLISWTWDTIHSNTIHASTIHAKDGNSTGGAFAAVRMTEEEDAGGLRLAALGMTEEEDSARYRRSPDISVRRAPRCEVLFALNPSSREIVTLNLAAWLAFELCDGRTGQELLSAYAESLGLGLDRAWIELVPALEQLESSGMIVRGASA